MADWNWHIALAKELLPLVNVGNKYDFLLGSIIPDMPWSDSNEEEELRGKAHMGKSRNISFGNIVDLDGWLDKYCFEVRKYDILKGALTHIILDHEVNAVLGLLVSEDILGMCHIQGVEADGRPLLEHDILRIKWSNLERFSIGRFGVQEDWLNEKSSWISHTASDIIYSHYGLPRHLQDDIVTHVLKRLPREPREADGPDIFTNVILSGIHDTCKAQCIRYLTLLERGGT